jgi:hypothetical protein
MAGRVNMVTWKGETLRAGEWADKIGVSRKAFISRLTRSGVEHAMTMVGQKQSSSEETAARRAAIYKIVKDQQPITVRGVFYQAEVLGIVSKDENGYKMVQTDLTLMRKSDEMPYEWLVDNTRNVIRPYAYASVADALEQLSENYAVNLWKDASCLVQVWLEKDALSGVIDQVTLDYGVPLMVARGFSSLSFLHKQASNLRGETRPVYVYLLGDYDPSGVNAHENIEKSLREMAPEVEFHFKRLGVAKDQIRRWKLPTRLTKQSDTRAAAWGDEPSVELDAIEPKRLRKIVQDAINKHLTEDELVELRSNEQAERDYIMSLSEAA